MAPKSENPRSRRIKSLSCHRCRAKKIKCDTKLPCVACVKEGIECVRFTSDKRKERYATDYTEKLQNRVEELERIVASVKSTKVDGLFSTFNPLSADSQVDELRLHMRGMSFESREKNRDSHNVSIYGPTSVFEHRLVEGVGSESHIEEILRLQRDLHVLQSIKLFFRWQYPDLCSFVVREAFLIEFFTPVVHPIYCSTELVLAICALGSRMSKDDEISKKSSRYYSEARNRILRRIDRPEISTMQAFLLLALFDIGNGNNTSGWMLSGCGMRMGFDLGFQLDPKIWYLKSSGTLSELSKGIRSRIFWGCYFAEHFISLVLGRPSTLKLADSTIPETQTLPDLDWITDYTYLSPGADPNDKLAIIDVSAPLNLLVHLLNLCADFLNDVFTQDGSEIFNLAEKIKKVHYYNQLITTWRQKLPQELQWNRESLRVYGENPTKMFISYFYYIFLLCLNRPFLEAANAETATEIDPPSIAICTEVIDDIIVAVSRFQSVHGLRRPSILIVYCCILAVSVLLISNVNNGIDDDCKVRLDFLMNVLHQCSNTWLLAQKAFRLSRSQLELLFSVQTIVTNESVQLSVPENVPKKTKVSDITKLLRPEKESLNTLDNFDIFGGPPFFMSTDMVNQEYGALFSEFLVKLDMQGQF